MFTPDQLNTLADLVAIAKIAGQGQWEPTDVLKINDVAEEIERMKLIGNNVTFRHDGRVTEGLLLRFETNPVTGKRQAIIEFKDSTVAVDAVRDVLGLVA